MSKQNREQKKKPNSPSGFLAGALLGGLAGAGAMLFLAPQSGRKTRAQLQKQAVAMRKQTMKTIEGGVTQVQTKAHEVSDTIHKQAEEIQKRGHDVLDNSKERISTAVQDGKERVSTAVQDGKERVSTAVQDGKELVSNAVSEGKERLSNAANDVSKAVQTGKTAVHEATA